jgi:hypothetical protein
MLLVTMQVAASTVGGFSTGGMVEGQRQWGGREARMLLLLTTVPTFVLLEIKVKMKMKMKMKMKVKMSKNE